MDDMENVKSADNQIMAAFMLIVSVALMTAEMVKGEEMLVTKAYIEYLKAHVSWEVEEYANNIFKAWTINDAIERLSSQPTQVDSTNAYPVVRGAEGSTLPESLDWRTRDEKCIHEVRNHGLCANDWAFAVAGMLSDRCCLQGETDHGWLSPQDISSCDKKSHGCNGGWPTWGLEYVISVQGVPTEDCCRYKGCMNPPCSDCKGCKRYCTCTTGLVSCVGIEGIRACLQGGPMIIAFGVCRSLYFYRGGVYKCDCGGSYLGVLSVNVVGYQSNPQGEFTVRTSYGQNWGENGYLRIGSDQCGLEGQFPLGNVACPVVKSP